MTAPTQPPVRPIAGRNFKRVADEMRPEGRKRRRVLALVAAYLDASHDRVTVVELSERLKLPPRQVAGILRRLEADGYLVVHWRSERPKCQYALPERGRLAEASSTRTSGATR